jgi:hypothetical protein
LRRRWIAVFPLMWLALATSAAAPTPSRKPPVMAIAGLLGGNTLVPLAQFARGKWVRTWPLPGEDVERKFKTLPRSWYPVEGGVPKEWYLWTEHLRGVPLWVSVPALAEAHCEVVWGLSTRLQNSGHETTAIATSVQTGVQPFIPFTAGAWTMDPLRNFLRTETEKAEAAEIRLKRSDAEALLSRRPDCDPVIEVSCVPLGREDDELCSFHASRRIGTRYQEAEFRCDDIAVVRGWYLRSAGVFTLLKSAVTLTDCDGKDERSAIPLVLITADSRRFIVVREHGYEDESFIVLEVRGNRIEPVLEVAGGGC